MIKFEDRLKIKRYIDTVQNLSSLSQGDLAPCMSFVKNLIEEATGKKIKDYKTIFANNISQIPNINRYQIKDIDDFNNLAFNGEILCITYTNMTIRHYALYCHIEHNGIHYNVIGVNGFYDYDPMTIYKGGILSQIRKEDFGTGREFFYENRKRNITNLNSNIIVNHIYKIPYVLY